MRPIACVRAVSPPEAWAALRRGEVRLLDLRTPWERRHYGAVPGAPRVSLLRHLIWPRGADTIYLCQHANRSKLTAWRGAAEVAGGWRGWVSAGLPVEHPPG